MNIERRPIFQAVRQLRAGQGFTTAEVRLLDAAIDEALASYRAPALPEPTFGTPREVDLPAFFDTMRDGRLLGPTLSQSEVDGCKAIIAACAGWPVSWIAYALATAWHETAGTMQPIKERGGAAYFRRMYDPTGARPQVAHRLGNTVPGDGVQFAGRGYVQLTGRANYARAQAELGAPFVGNPDLAMRPDHAASIMARGMTEGWFTGRKLSDFLPEMGPATHSEFLSARRIINGIDRADDIAGYAIEFQKGLMA